MLYNPDLHKRRSIRLKDYNYSKEGLYFVTIGIKDKLCLFGEVFDNQMILTEGGEVIVRYWKELENKFDNISLHSYVVMPNHFHGIIEIVGADLCVCPSGETQSSDETQSLDETQSSGGTRRFTPTGGEFIYHEKSLPSIVQWFKTMSTNAYIYLVNENKVKPFNKKLWQRNYYEHIIRDEKSYNKITDYINSNPIKWKEDIFYNDEI